MNIQLLDTNKSDVKAEVLIEFLTQNDLKEHSDVNILNSAGFKAEQDSICFLHEKATLFCGVESKNSDDIRSASAIFIKTLKNSNYKSAKIRILSD